MLGGLHCRVPSSPGSNSLEPRMWEVTVISYVRWISVLMLVVPADAFGAGFIHDETFCVFTPAIPTQEAGQRFAQQVHQRAIEYRAEIAREWLGEELAPGTGRTVINVEL